MSQCNENIGSKEISFNLEIQATDVLHFNTSMTLFLSVLHDSKTFGTKIHCYYNWRSLLMA